jgi:hypothetical protein
MGDVVRLPARLRLVKPKADDEIWWDDFPHIAGFGTAHDMRDAEDKTIKSRLWDLKSTSKAACIAYDKRPAEKSARRIGFAARRPK